MECRHLDLFGVPLFGKALEHLSNLMRLGSQTTSLNRDRACYHLP